MSSLIQATKDNTENDIEAKWPTVKIGRTLEDERRFQLFLALVASGAVVVDGNVPINFKFENQGGDNWLAAEKLCKRLRNLEMIFSELDAAGDRLDMKA